MAGVFLSYGRDDALEFVGWLQGELASRGRDVWVDSDGIVGGTMWLDEIHRAIEAADAFVFVLTPASVRSDVCKRELAHAVAHGKRLLWIRREQVPDEQFPEVLRPIHWVSFRGTDDPQQGLHALIRALDQDLAWERERTMLLGRALAWQRVGADDSFLLRDTELVQALSWSEGAGARPGRALDPTIQSYLDASAVTRVRDKARSLEVEARAVGRELAAQAQIVRERGAASLERSVLLAAEAMLRAPSLEADVALRAGLVLLPRPLLRQPYDRPVEVVRFSRDGRYLAAGGRDGLAHVCETGGGGRGFVVAHGAEVRDLAFDNGGRWLATAGADGVVALWDLATGALSTRLVGAGSLSRICVGPDDATIAAASWNGTATVWDVVSGRESLRVQHEAAILRLEFSPTGDRLATASQDGSARVWALPSGAELFRITTLPSETGAVRPMRRVVFLPDGTRLAVASGDGTALVCDAQTGAVILPLAHDHPVYALACSADGRWLATGDGGGVSLWEARTGRLHRRIDVGAIIVDLAFDCSGRVLAAGCHDGSARIWDCIDGVELVRSVHDHVVCSVALSPDGRLLATASSDHAYDQWLDSGGPALPRAGRGNAASLWEARGGARAGEVRCDGQVHGFDAAAGSGRFGAGTASGTVHLWSGVDGAAAVRCEVGAVQCVRFAPDGRKVALGGADGVGAIVDADTGTVLARIGSLGAVRVGPLQWTPDGHRVVGGLADGTARVWDATTGVELARRTHGRGPVDVRCHPDGVRIISAGGDGVLVWDATSGRDLFALPGDLRETALALSPDGSILATATADGRVAVVRLDKPEVVGHLIHGGQVLVMQFTGDGARLATGGEDRCARVWDIRDSRGGTEVCRCRHDEYVWGLAFSPDGKHLATGSVDRTSRIWSIGTGREVARMAHTTAVSQVRFTGDGRALATISDRTVRFWLWQPGAMLSDAAARLTRNLTDDEWRQYLPGEPYRPTFTDLIGPPPMVLR